MRDTSPNLPGGDWECRLDRILGSVCERSEEFVRWFMGQALPHVRFPPGVPTVSLNVWEEVPGGHSGETDVLLEWRDGDVPELRVRVENKIGAPFTPRQAERYLGRCARDGGWAVLVAPGSRIRNRARVETFHGTVAVEDVAERLAALGDTRGKDELLEVLQMARHEREPHLPTAQFNLWFHDALEVAWLSFGRNTTDKQGWLYAHLPTVPGVHVSVRDNVLIYKTFFEDTKTGCVDITVRHLRTVYGTDYEHLGLPKGFQRAEDSKGEVFRHEVPAVYPREGAPEPGSAREDAVRQAVSAMVAAASWLVQVIHPL